MSNTFEKLNLFFDKIKTITFWQRIFNWSVVRSMSYDAYEEFKSLIVQLDQLSADLEETRNSFDLLQNNNQHLQRDYSEAENSLTRLQEKFDTQSSAVQNLKTEFASQGQKLQTTENESSSQKQKIAILEEKIDHLEAKNRELENSNNRFLQTEEGRRQKYDSDITNINKIRQQIQDDRAAETEARQRDEIEKLKAQKETWTKHETLVKNQIKMLCQKHTIEYVDKVPFKGNPDNTIQVCDEYIIFDAKSPGSDDLQNFKAYIKNQTEAVVKYTKQENVKKDVFLVIPSNTVSVIDQFCYNMADYNVYVVTLDSLEPIILCLKRIEDYEFLEELSPEEKENICRIVGKFAHTAKRRIQIDQFFAREFFDILSKCDKDVPRDMLDKIVGFEKSEKLNPPIEKRVKQISTDDLLSDTEKIQREADAKGIALLNITQEGIKKLPLYNDESQQPAEV